jgi:hypothetical protein
MFSEELMDIFRIDDSVADLGEKVDKRSVCLQMPCKPPPRRPRQASAAHLQLISHQQLQYNMLMRHIAMQETTDQYSNIRARGS